MLETRIANSLCLNYNCFWFSTFHDIKNNCLQCKEHINTSDELSLVCEAIVYYGATLHSYHSKMLRV